MKTLLSALLLLILVSGCVPSDAQPSSNDAPADFGYETIVTSAPLMTPMVATLEGGSLAVPAPVQDAAVTVSKSDPPYYFLDLVSVIPDSCQTFRGIEVHRSEAEIIVSVNNQLPDYKSGKCYSTSQVLAHSVALGSGFEPGTGYTVRVKGIPRSPIAEMGSHQRGDVTYRLGEGQIDLTFVGVTPADISQSSSGTVVVPAYTAHGARVSIDESHPPNHFAEIRSAVMGCGEFDGIEVERYDGEIVIHVNNRRPVAGTCTSMGLSYATHLVSLGADFEPSATYNVWLNVRGGGVYTAFSGWQGYDVIGDRDTIEIPATIRRVAISYDAAGHHFLDIDAGLPNNCSKYHGSTVEQDGTTIRVSVLNEMVADPAANCATVYRSSAKFSSPLGTDIESGVTYNVNVNDLSIKFNGLPRFESSRISAPIQSVVVVASESEPPYYWAEVVSRPPTRGCVLFDQTSVRRIGTNLYISVSYRSPVSSDTPCPDVGHPPQDHRVGLGKEFEPGVEYTLRVNDTWTGSGDVVPPAMVTTTFVPSPPKGAND